MKKQQEKFEENVSFYVGEHKEHIKAVLRQNLINNGLKDSSIINILSSDIENYTRKIIYKGVKGSIDKNGKYKQKESEIIKERFFYRPFIKYEINGIENIIYGEEMLGTEISDHSYNSYYSLDMIEKLNIIIEYEEYKIKFPNKEIKTKLNKI